MGWLDDLVGGSSGGGGIFGGGSIWDGSSGGNFGGGSGWSISDLWGDIGQDGSITDNLGWLSGNGDGGIWDWAGGLTGGDSGGGGWGDILGKIAGGALNGGQAGGQQGQGNIWGSLLGGLSGAAGQYLKGKDLREQAEAQGREMRKTRGFEADLLDYYAQLDKKRKRVALDTYGQFSLLGNNVTPAPAIEMPTKPNPGG